MGTKVSIPISWILLLIGTIVEMLGTWSNWPSAALNIAVHLDLKFFNFSRAVLAPLSFPLRSAFKVSTVMFLHLQLQTYFCGYNGAYRYQHGYAISGWKEVFLRVTGEMRMHSKSQTP